MTQAQLIHDIDIWVIWFVFAVSVTFPVVTGAFWPWWRSAWGWNIVLLELAIALALFPAWLSIVFTGLTERFLLAFEWLQIGSVSLVGIVVVWRTFLIWRTQVNAERERKTQEDDL